MRTLVIAATCVATALLAACGEDTSGVCGTDGTVEEETTPSAGPVVLVAEPQNSGMDSLITGRLTVLGGCLGVGDSVVVWPEGTEVLLDDPVRIEVPGRGTYSLDSEIELGGGHLEPAADGTVGGAVGGAEVPEACAATGEVFLASS